MKTYVKPLALFVFVLISAHVNAQETSGKLRAFKLDSVIPNPDLTLANKVRKTTNPTSPFNHLLPLSGNLTRKHIVIESEVHDGTIPYHYHMPIVKPAKTSKILIARLDPNFPYQNNTPVLKQGTDGK